MATPGFPQRGFLRFSGPFLAGLASLSFYSALVFVPLVGIFFGLFSPLPLVRELAWGRSPLLAWGWVLVALAGTALATHSLLLAVYASGYLLLAAWPTVTVEWWQRRVWPTGRWLAIVTLGSWIFVSLLAIALAGDGQVGEFFSQQAVSWVEANRNFAQFWTLGRQQLMVSAASLGGYLLPSLAAMYTMGLGLWLRPRLSGLGKGKEPFASYASEEWLPLGFVAGALGWAFAPGVWGWLSANLLVTVVALYFVHGTAILLAFLGPKLGNNRWIKAAVVVFGVQLPVAFLYAALGLFDSFVKLRRPTGDEGSSL